MSKEQRIKKLRSWIEPWLDSHFHPFFKRQWLLAKAETQGIRGSDVDHELDRLLKEGKIQHDTSWNLKNRYRIRRDS